MLIYTCHYGTRWLTSKELNRTIRNIVRCSSEEAANGVRAILPASAMQRRPDRPAADTERQPRRPCGNQRVEDTTGGTAVSNVGNRPGGRDLRPHTPGEHQLELMTLLRRNDSPTLPLAVTPFTEPILILVGSPRGPHYYMWKLYIVVMNILRIKSSFSITCL